MILVLSPLLSSCSGALADTDSGTIPGRFLHSGHDVVIEDVGVPHCRLDVGMTERLFDEREIPRRAEEFGRKVVAKIMAGNR